MRQLLRACSLLSLLAFTPCLRAQTSSPPTAKFTPVFLNNTDGYQCFRIPAIVQTPNGTLLAFAEGRRTSCGDFGNLQIVMRSSHDHGKSWGPLQVLASNGALQTDNPVPIVDTLDPRYPHGRIFLLYNTGDVSENDLRAGKGTRHIWYRASVDNGVTWADPVEITDGLIPASWRVYAIGPGHGLLLTHGPHAGRLLATAYHSEGPAQKDNHDYAAHSIFSDDHGRTWQLGATVAWPGSNESTAAQRSDGTVVMNSRDQSGESLARLLSLSADGGWHWDTTFVAHDLPDPRCQGSLIAFSPSKSRQVLLFSNPSSPVLGDRSHLTVSVSSDGGLTWPKRTVLYPGPAAYSDLVILPKGQLGILWEGRDQGGIVFLSTPIRPLL